MYIKSVVNNRGQAAGVAVVLLIALLFLVPSLATAQGAPAPTPPASSFDQRLAQRKAERNITIDEKSQKRIVGLCTQAQGKIRALQQKNTASLNNRSKIYQQMDGKLWVIIGKLKLAEKDTFNLEKQRSTLAEKSASFQATSQLYQQSLDDLVVVNCKADPAGFQALLDTSRFYRTQLRDQAADLKNYVVNDVKSTLGTFATELQTKSSTEAGN